MWKNIVEPETHIWQYGASAFHARYVRPQTHSQYVTLIAFLLQQRLHESASLLRDMHIACLVFLGMSVGFSFLSVEINWKYQNRHMTATNRILMPSLAHIVARQH
jgi:hypothetical protein